MIEFFNQRCDAFKDLTLNIPRGWW